jgi:molybdopterin synthase catalytic subunit
MERMMNLPRMIERIKQRPDFADAGMILCHNGVVRNTSRDGRPVSGLSVAVDHDRLTALIDAYKKRPGIVDILIEIAEDRRLRIGDDVMYIVVAGDVRENVIGTLQDVLNDVKTQVTRKTEFFEDERE